MRFLVQFVTLRVSLSKEQSLLANYANKWISIALMSIIVLTRPQLWRR